MLILRAFTPEGVASLLSLDKDSAVFGHCARARPCFAFPTVHQGGLSDISETSKTYTFVSV